MNGFIINFILFSLFIYAILIKSAFSDFTKSITDLTTNINQLVDNTFNEIFKPTKINEKFIELNNMAVYELIKVDPLSIAKTASDLLAKEIRKKMKALEKSVKYAEEVVSSYQIDRNIQHANVSYLSSKNESLDESLFVYNSQFNTKVIPHQSTVHIPTEIYDGDISVLNTIQWTKKLNSVFQANADTLRYQYFAATDGTLINYPGMRWRKTGVDMYDVRRRQWYVQGASSPKDVMILIDTSGSMHGRAIKLTTTAVIKLIDSMGENDYIAVAQFPNVEGKKNSTPHLLMDNAHSEENRRLCFETFVQANKRNKLHLFHQIEQLSAKGQAHLNEALEFAVKSFHEFDAKHKSDHEGSNCNRIIVVLTDGSDEYDREHIRTLVNSSPKTKNIRIFIYSIGEDIHPTDVLESITCDYRGHFGHIQAYGAVSNIIEKYSVVVHNHRVHDNMSVDTNEFRIFTAAIDQDGFLDPKDFPGGLGLMTSLTMPVYNRTGNTSFLGLLGTDMTIKSMQNHVPQDIIGPTGYGFAINTNGFIIFHPLLKAQTGWMKDPPNVDLSEIEFFSEENMKVRKKIIDCASSNGTDSKQVQMTSLIKVIDGIHTYEKERTFAFTGVPFSSFGIVIVNSIHNKFHSKFNSDKIKLINVDTSCASNTFECTVTVSLGELVNKKLKFARGVLLLSESLLIQSCELSTQPKDQSKRSPGSSTNQPAVKSIQSTSSKLQNLFSITQSSFVSSSMPSLSPNSVPASLANTNLSLDQDNETENDSTNGTSSWTSTPMQMINNQFSFHLFKALKQIQTNTSKCPKDFQNQIILDIFILEMLSKDFLRHSFEDVISSLVISTMSGITMIYPESSFKFYENMFDKPWNSSLFQRSFDNPDQFIFTVDVNYKDIRDFSNTTKAKDILILKSFSALPMKEKNIPVAVMGMTLKYEYLLNLMKEQIACRVSRICFILEDSAFIVATNDEDMIRLNGKFYGDVDPDLMEEMMNNSIFLRTVEYDYQASCPRDQSGGSSSSSNKLMNSLSKLPYFLYKFVVWIIQNTVILFKLFIHVIWIQTTNAQEVTATDNKNISCIKKGYRYYLSRQFTSPVQITMNCSKGFSMVDIIAAPIPTTNTILISMDRSYLQVCRTLNKRSLPRMPIQDSTPDICTQSKYPKYRMRPENKCYSFDPNEDFMKCNSQIFTINTYLILILCFLVFCKIRIL